MSWGRIRKIALGILFVLSLYLSFVLWRNPGGYILHPDNTETPVVSSVTFDRRMSAVFGPTEVVEHTDQGSFLTKDSKMLNNLFSVFRKGKIADLMDPVSVDGESYMNRVTGAGNLEFVFSSSIPFDLYGDLFSFLPREYENRTFNRIYLSVHDLETVYFYNTHSQLFYEASVTDIDPNVLRETLNEAETETYTVQSVYLNDHIAYLPVNSFELPVLNYLVEEQPNSLFIERLFNDTSEIQTIVNGDHSRYYDYFSELTIDNEKDILKYSKPQASADNISLTERVRNSFDELIQFEHWPNEIYFYGLSSATNQTEFRRYLHGYPVFGTTDYGGTFITVSENGLIDLEMPTIVAQTPISSNNAMGNMESMQELILDLNSQGYSLNSIEDIKVGYTWNYSSESSRVITLSPEWYVKRNGRWVSVQSLGKEAQGGEGDGF